MLKEEQTKAKAALAADLYSQGQYAKALALCQELIEVFKQKSINDMGNLHVATLLNSMGNTILKHMFERETEQFQHGLPMYARKEEFLDLFENNQAIVLKGGTGIGKTVTVPQWVLDKGFYEKG